MKLLHSLHQRQIVQLYQAKAREINLNFAIEALQCHKDDQHKVKGLDTEVEVPPFACSFNKSLLSGHMLAVADEDGGVCLFDVRKQGSSSKLKGWIAHSNAIFDITWIHDEPQLITASGDQTAQLWDVQYSTRLAIFRGHSCSLKSVDFQEENLFVFATGARDGNVMIWDTRCNKRNGYYQPVNTIRNCHSTLNSGTPQRTKRRGRRTLTIVTQDSQQSVTSVKFQDPSTIISAGAVDGNIKVWDLRKNYSTLRTEPVPYHVFPYPGTGSRKHGFSSLVLDSTKSKLFANCTNDVIYMYDCISFKKTPLAFFCGHSNATFYVKSAVSPDDQFLLSGSGDYDGYIWKISDPTAPPFHLTGHVGEVTSVAWCPQDQGKAVTCSDDNNLNVWRVNFEAKDNKREFVGWCKRNPCENLPSEMKDQSNKLSTPHTSPARSRNESVPSSPVSLSPNLTKCSSPQQFLQSWLRSNSDGNSSGGNNNNSKRSRESDSETSWSKRYCLEDRLQVDILHDHRSNVESTKDSNPLATTCENKNLENTSHQDTNQKLKDFMESDANKENIRTNVGNKAKFKHFHCVNKQVQSNLDKEKDKCLTEKITALVNRSGVTETKSEQTICKNQSMNEDKIKLNWLGAMSGRLRNERCKRSLRNGASERGIKSEKSSSQPGSPVATESCSPVKELTAVVKSMKCIREYFKPLPESDEDSPSKYCER